MPKNKFSHLFNTKENSTKLSLIYFNYYDKVEKEDREELREAFLDATRKAEHRELVEAGKGIFS